MVAVFVHSQCIPGRATFLAYFTNGSNVQVLGFNVLNDPLFNFVDQSTLKTEPIPSERSLHFSAYQTFENKVLTQALES